MPRSCAPDPAVIADSGYDPVADGELALGEFAGAQTAVIAPTAIAVRGVGPIACRNIGKSRLAHYQRHPAAITACSTKGAQDVARIGSNRCPVGSRECLAPIPALPGLRPCVLPKITKQPCKDCPYIGINSSENTGSWKGQDRIADFGPGRSGRVPFIPTGSVVIVRRSG